MLKVRILTALAVLLLLLSAIFYLQDIFWVTFLLALTVIGAREWSKLAQLSVRTTIAFMVLTVLIGGELLFLLRESVQINFIQEVKKRGYHIVPLDKLLALNANA